MSINEGEIDKWMSEYMNKQLDNIRKSHRDENILYDIIK